MARLHGTDAARFFSYDWFIRNFLMIIRLLYDNYDIVLSGFQRAVGSVTVRNVTAKFERHATTRHITGLSPLRADIKNDI